MYIKKIFLIIVALTLVAGAVFSYSVYAKIFNSNTAFAEEKREVYIPTNSSFKEVITILKPHLKSTEDFAWLAQKKGYANNPKPGHFILNKGLNTNEIIGVLRSQNTPVKIRFNNQERLEDLAGRLSTQIEPDSITLLKVFKDADFLKSNAFDEKTILTMFIPNSYEVYWNTSAKAFRDKMLKEYKRFWNANRIQKAKNINMTPQQVSTLASIVHKETAQAKERPKVAGVYMNRLLKGMRLEADPTVIYALKDRAQNWDLVIKRVLRKDLTLEHPYNTYQNTGLPPGPIAMPDITAIDAVLNYEKHDYLFFVADVQNFGYHKFAKTLLQHNRNSASYHKWISAQGVNR